MPVPRPSHVATRLLPSWMICSTNQGRAYFEFQMLAGKRQAGIWALGNIQEENGFVLSLRRSLSHPAGGCQRETPLPLRARVGSPPVAQPQETQHLFKHFLGYRCAQCYPAAWLGLCQWDRMGWGGSILGAPGHRWQ